MTAGEWKNKLYYGDNLIWLRDPKHFPDESVDLIYLDPPFNSSANYNVIFNEPGGQGSQAQIRAFDDTWHWESDASAKALEDLGSSRGKPEIIDLVDWIARRGDSGSTSLAAYLAMMSIRLVELHRVLRPTGSLYLHCDPTASHYLKALLDTIFGGRNFKNEIIWRRTGSNSAARRFGPLHQTIFYYAKSGQCYFCPVPMPYSKAYVEDFFTEEDSRGRYQSVSLTGPGRRTGDSGLPWRRYNPGDVGRHWQPSSYLYSKYQALTGDDLARYPLLERLDRLDEVGLIHWGGPGTVPRYKYYLSDAPGVYLQDIWAYQPGTQGCIWGRPDIGIDQDVKWLSANDRERLGYATQKPEGVLERIIRASSREGDVVLDPFCGCGTTIAVAQRLNRRWLGIDVTWLSIDKVTQRLLGHFGADVADSYEVYGKPVDEASARALAGKDKKEFEIWAISLVGAAQREWDGGVDGVLSIAEDRAKHTKVVVQVKGGENLNPGMVRDLIGTVEKEKAAIGLLITLDEHTRGMKELAAHAGSYSSPIWGKSYPRIQLRTVAEVLGGKGFDLPYGESPAKKALRAKQRDETPRMFCE